MAVCVSGWIVAVAVLVGVFVAVALGVGVAVGANGAWPLAGRAAGEAGSLLLIWNVVVSMPPTVGWNCTVRLTLLPEPMVKGGLGPPTIWKSARPVFAMLVT